MADILDLPALVRAAEAALTVSPDKFDDELSQDEWVRRRGFKLLAVPDAVLAMARRIEELSSEVDTLTCALDAASLRHDQELRVLDQSRSREHVVLDLRSANVRAEQAEQRALDAERLAVALADVVDLSSMSMHPDQREQVYAIRARLAGKEGAK